MKKNVSRGIAPELLLSQVKNTMPYLFDEGLEQSALKKIFPAQVVREFAEKISREPSLELDHLDYFRLCLASHFLTVGTPVPTDVDNQIRLKLWPAHLGLDTALAMADLVLSAHEWDFTLLSTRFTWGAAGSPWEKELVSGHHGEWFTVAAGAYCALKQYKDSRADAKRDELYEAITQEVHRHSEIFGSLWRAQEGLKCLKASASIAHNFGDLDRVMDMWELDIGDPLRLRYYKLAASPYDPDRKLRYLGRLWVAGELYKAIIPAGATAVGEGSAMAHENHRYFALRKPRCLRQSPELLIPIGPFFDDWGRRVARTFRGVDGAPSGETLEVVEALLHGWARLPHTYSYVRALRGMLEAHPELDVEALKKVPAIRKILETSQERFEKRWSDEALAVMDEIPSRA